MKVLIAVGVCMLKSKSTIEDIYIYIHTYTHD